MKQVTIQLQIADRPYRLIVGEEQESFFHESCKMINKQLKAYSERYAFKDPQDLLAMVALQYTYDSIKKSSDSAKTEEGYKTLIEALLNLESSIDEVVV